jgi:hypothetical protein
MGNVFYFLRGKKNFLCIWIVYQITKLLINMWSVPIPHMWKISHEKNLTCEVFQFHMWNHMLIFRKVKSGELEIISRFPKLLALY